mmetsp:Transcript_16741/g.42591  ORF Transcript_16741/g.42591 Transcript_16741/m.42591 type:complete len:700 (-) Transcript_16741:102-2201(-)
MLPTDGLPDIHGITSQKFFHDPFERTVASARGKRESDMSLFTKLANDRLEEFAQQPNAGKLGLWPSSRTMDSRSARGPVTIHATESDPTAFYMALESVQTMLGAQQPEPIQLKRGEVYTEILPASWSRFLVITLPRRIGKIVIRCEQFAMNSSGQLEMYGSTTQQRPNSRNYAFRGDEDRVEKVTMMAYDHAYMKITDVPGDMVDEIDRHRAVPPTQALYVGIEAFGGDVHYSVSYTIAAVKVTLTHKEIARKRLARQQNLGFQVIMNQAQTCDEARQDFAQHLVTLRTARRKKQLEMASGKDFGKFNRQVATAAPAARFNMIEAKAAAREQARQAAYATSQRLVEERREQLIHRIERREKMGRNPEEHGLERVRIWTTLFVAAAFVRKVHESHSWQVLAHEHHVAARKIADVWTSRQAARRRREMYRNILLLRGSVAAFTRVNRVAFLHRAVEVVKHFFRSSKRTQNESVVALRAFRAKVIRLQRGFRQMVKVRQCRVAGLARLFRRNEARAIEDEKAAAAQAQEAGRQDKWRLPTTRPVERAPVDDAALEVVLRAFLHEMQARHQLKLAEWGQSNEVLAFMGVRPPRPTFLSEFRSAMRGLLPIARKVSKFMVANPGVKPWRLVMRQAGVPEMRTLFRSKRHTAVKKSLQREASTSVKAPVSIPLSGRNASGLAVRSDRPPAMSGSIFSLSGRVPEA